MITDTELLRASDEALRLSGYTDELYVHENVDGMGTAVVYRALSRAEFAELWNGLAKGTTAAQNARRMGFSRAVIIPERVALNDVVQRVPGLPQAALDPICRLCGAGDWGREPDTILVDSDDVATELVARYGFDAAELAMIRQRYYKRAQLRAVIVGDPGLGRTTKAYLLKTPGVEALEMFERRRGNVEELYEATVDFATDGLAYPSDEKAIRSIFESRPALPTTMKVVLEQMARPAREAAGKGWRRSSAHSPT